MAWADPSWVLANKLQDAAHWRFAIAGQSWEHGRQTEGKLFTTFRGVLKLHLYPSCTGNQKKTRPIRGVLAFSMDTPRFTERVPRREASGLEVPVVRQPALLPAHALRQPRRHGVGGVQQPRGPWVRAPPQLARPLQNLRINERDWGMRGEGSSCLLLPFWLYKLKTTSIHAEVPSKTTPANLGLFPFKPA